MLKFVPVVWAGWRKRSRSILILLQVIVAFTLFGVLQGLASGINHAIGSTHADRLYVGSKLNLGNPVAIAIVDWLKTVPGVREMTYRYHFGASYQRPQQRIPICATDVDSYLAVYPEDKVNPAQLRALRQIQDGAIVGIGTMHKYGWRVGQRVALQSPQLPRKDGTGNWRSSFRYSPRGLLLAIPAALRGAGIDWYLFNGHVLVAQGITFPMAVTPHLVVVALCWALSIALFSAILPAIRAARLPVAAALRAT